MTAEHGAEFFEMREQHRMQRLTKEGKPFEYPSIADMLDGQEFVMAPEILDVEKRTSVCVDDGMDTINPAQIFYPISGTGAGEDPVLIGKILPEGVKLKPHAHCGKATLVLKGIRSALGQPAPTHEDVDNFAQAEVIRLGAAINRPVGRMVSFDERKTALKRPVELHPADGAHISLSERLPHNLLPEDVRKSMPMQFGMAGHYYENYPDQDLIDFAVREATLVNQIASSDHGIGVVDRGFRYTAWVDKNDPEKFAKLAGLKKVWSHTQAKLLTLRADGAELNDVHLDVIEYELTDCGDEGCKVRFEKVFTSDKE